MKARILVVDDEESIREILSSMLTSVGYQCTLACNGVEALAVLNSGAEFEVLVSGLLMPEMDGMTLFERTKESFPDMPFVVVTAVHDESVEGAVYRAGVYDFLRKPFPRERLVAAVRRAMEYRRLKLENREYRAKLGL